MTRIFLVRHGNTVYNASRRHGGNLHNVLTEKGKRQARLLASRLAHFRVDAIYSSPLRRAVQTAEFVSRRVRKPIIVEPSFRELNFGILENLPFEEADATHPNAIRRVLSNSWHRIPEGESFRMLQARVVPKLLDIARRHPRGKVVIVAHYLVNKAILATLLGLPLEQAKVFDQRNCCLNIIDISERGLKVHLVNGVADERDYAPQ